MRQEVKDFLVLVDRHFTLRPPIYEFGAFQVAGQEGFADLRPLFPGKEYIGCDMRPGPGVDRVLDLHQIDLPSGCAGTVLCLDTLEHVADPLRATKEIHRILGSGGVAVVSSVMNHPIHEFPNDYWRFTPQAFQQMLAAFRCSFVGSAGRSDFPRTVVGVGFQGFSPDLQAFEREYVGWRAEYGAHRVLDRTVREVLRPWIPQSILRLRAKIT